ncbi:MAG: hypothetical protein AB1349_14140, partial [Elusimicrobiota bacterium]
YSFAVELEGWGIGINYPGFAIKYCFGTNILELRSQNVSEGTELDSKQTNLTGLRYYKYGLINETILYYLGGEISYFKYQNKETTFNADGFVTGIFIGIEKFFLQKFSINIDVGPYYAMAFRGSSSTELSDIVMNATVNYYFKGLR